MENLGRRRRHHRLIPNHYNHSQQLPHYFYQSRTYFAPPPAMAAIPLSNGHFLIQQVGHRIAQQRSRVMNDYQSRRENNLTFPSRAYNPSQFLAEEETLIIDLHGGEIKTLLTEKTISKHLKKRTFSASSNQRSNLETIGTDPDEEAEICAICLSEYGDNDTLGILHCRHEYHSECLKKWLLKKNICPLCNRTALPEL